MCFSDDCNLVTASLSSLLQCFHFIELFKEASGLELNYGKTKGVFFNKNGVFRTEQLPRIEWVNKLEILGIYYGPVAYVNSQWASKVKELKGDIKFFNNVQRNTLQDKAILSKAKLLPKLSYIGNVHPIPNNIVKQIDCVMLKFIVSHDKTIKTLYDFAAGKMRGGYCIDHVTLHTSLFLLKPIIEYIRAKINGEDIPSYLYATEYNVGLQLCTFFNLPICNALPHAVHPNPVYDKCLKMVIDQKITTEECLRIRAISHIYHRIVNGYGDRKHYACDKLYRLHYKCLPEYVRSFNYRLYFNLLPLNTKFVSYALDTDSRCYFCNWGPENEWHIFGKCEKLRKLWSAMDEVIKICVGCNYSFTKNRTELGDYDLAHTRCPDQFEKIIIYLNCIINHKIWKMRNDIKHNGDSFDVEVLYTKILRSVGARKNIESRLTEDKKIDKINDLFGALTCVKNIIFTNQRDSVR